MSAGKGTAAWGEGIKAEPYLWQQIVAGPAEDHTVSFAAVDGVVLPPLACFVTKVQGLAAKDGIRRGSKNAVRTTPECASEPLSPETIAAMVKKLRYHGHGNLAYRVRRSDGVAVIFDVNTRVGGPLQGTAFFADRVLEMARAIDPTWNGPLVLPATFDVCAHGGGVHRARHCVCRRHVHAQGWQCEGGNCTHGHGGHVADNGAAGQVSGWSVGHCPDCKCATRAPGPART